MKVKRKIVVGLSLILFISISSAPAQQEEHSFPYSSFMLENGLTVILSVDKSLPLVSIVAAYNVGSAYDFPGKYGMAYLMENLMMFHGSRNIGPMQNINYLNRIGGEFNAETNADKTIFSQTVPSNQLALVLWLESDRMNSLSINASSVQQAKNSLIEENQIALAMNPFRESAVYFDHLLYANPAYSHPVMGTDINAIRDISLDDVSNFFSSYYSPNNAVISIVGNIDIAQTSALIRKYFESIPAGKTIDPLNLEKPKEISDVKETFKHILAQTPGFYLGFRLSLPYTRDYYTLTIIDYLLLQGKSSRLYKKLLRQRIAFHLEGGINYVQEKEQQKTKNMFKADYLKQFETTLGKAVYLAKTFLDKGNLEKLFSELNKYMQVTPAHINIVMNNYFSKGSILLEIEIR